jgi:hypothetical protein
MPNDSTADTPTLKDTAYGSDEPASLGTCGVAGRAPNGDTLRCDLPACPHMTHCDSAHDGMWWRDGELGRSEVMLYVRKGC